MEKKHLTRFFMLAVAAGTLFGACQKEDIAAVEDDFDMTGRIPLYTVTPKSASGSKIAVDAAPTLQWMNGDKIAVKDHSTIEVYNRSIPEAGISAPVLAFYPANLNPTFNNDNSVEFTLPDSYTYTKDERGYQKLELPMMAYDNDLSGGILFKAVTSVMAVHVYNSTSSSISLESIRITHGKFDLHGPVSATYDDGILSDGESIEGYFTVTMNFTNEAECIIPAGGNEYVLIPIKPTKQTSGDPGKFSITVMAHDADDANHLFLFNKEQGITSKQIKANEIAYAAVSMDNTTDLNSFELGGEYYLIARGNLKYNTVGSVYSLMDPFETLEDGSKNDDHDFKTGTNYSGFGGQVSLFCYGADENEDPTAPLTLPLMYSAANGGSVVEFVPYDGELDNTTDWGARYGSGWQIPTTDQWNSLLENSFESEYLDVEGKRTTDNEGEDILGRWFFTAKTPAALIFYGIYGANSANDIKNKYGSEITTELLEKCGAIFIAYPRYTIQDSDDNNQVVGAYDSYVEGGWFMTRDGNRINITDEYYEEAAIESWACSVRLIRKVSQN